MATVGRIVIDVTANTAKFVKDLDRASRKTESFGEKLKKLAGGVMRRVAQAAVAASAALVGLSIAGVRAGDQLAKTAEKLGLTAAALAGMRFAAEQTGVAMNQLDMGVQRVVRRISEAAQGTGEAKDALKELGLDAVALNRLAPEQQFIELAKAMEQVENQGDRVRLSMRLFDSEGVALVNTLGLGADALREMFERSRELGLALTTDQVRAAEEANAAIQELGASWSGLTLQLGAAFGPAIESAAGFLTTFVTKMTGGIPTLVFWLENLTGIRRQIEDLALRDVELRLTEAQERLIQQVNREKAAREELGRLRRARGDERDAIGIANAERDISDALASQSVQRSLISELTDRGNTLRREERDGVEQTAQSYEELLASMQNTVAARERMVSQRLLALPSLGPEQIFDVEPGLDDIFDMTNLERRMLGIVPALNEPLEEAIDVAEDQWGRFGLSMGRSLEDSLVNSFLGIETGFRDLLKRMMAQLIVSGLLTGLGSAAPAGSFFAKALGFLGVGGPEGRQFGGRGTAGKAVVVGERRQPELFIPDQNGTFISGQLHPFQALPDQPERLEREPFEPPEREEPEPRVPFQSLVPAPEPREEREPFEPPPPARPEPPSLARVLLSIPRPEPIAPREPPPIPDAAEPRDRLLFPIPEPREAEPTPRLPFEPPRPDTDTVVRRAMATSRGPSPEPAPVLVSTPISISNEVTIEGNAGPDTEDMIRRAMRETSDITVARVGELLHRQWRGAR